MKNYSHIKKEIFIRALIIGAMHSVLYLWLVPFVIYPKFGKSGFLSVLAVAILISVLIIGTLLFNKRKRDNTTKPKPYGSSKKQKIENQEKI
ncbi:MAG: hypothetical protein HQK68_10525 [Desulfamplus sp.]|nr:hypothetical protein [Desulfamplus sp.]